MAGHTDGHAQVSNDAPQPRTGCKVLNACKHGALVQSFMWEGDIATREAPAQSAHSRWQSLPAIRACGCLPNSRVLVQVLVRVWGGTHGTGTALGKSAQRNVLIRFMEKK